MKIINNETTTIHADEGMMLTNQKVYAKTVDLGVADNPSNWQEITEQEYNNIIKESEI